jgi:hypothetical protein
MLPVWIGGTIEKSMLPMTEQYYALCVEEEDGSTEIAFFELRMNY